MALTNPRRDRGWSRLRFVGRVAGVTGLLVAAIGLVLLAVELRDLGLVLVCAGGAIALVAFLVEIRAALSMLAGRRGAFGSNVALQVVLAILLLVGLNWFSFANYYRADWTRNHQFTLSTELRDKLSRLHGKTIIVAYLRHKTFGQLSDKPDAYDYAAERKVVEKVKDVVDQFRELGPQFQVSVLDVEEEAYNVKLDKIVEDVLSDNKAQAPPGSSQDTAADEAQSKELRNEIDSTLENSVLFYGGGKRQRLSFNDFYQLNKTASQEANDNHGNLVLLYQGVEPFARKVLNIDAKKPRIALAVIHEILGMEGSEELGMAGVKKTFSAHGFDSRDIILKKWSEMAPPEPAVATYDESKYERLEDQLAEVNANLKSTEEDLSQLKKEQARWQSASLEDLTKDYAKQLEVERVSEPIRTAYIQRVLNPNIALRQFLLVQQREDRDAMTKEKSGLNVESLAEQRRIADLKAKTDRILADCDLLIIPRMTLLNVSTGERIPNQLYRLDDAQVAGIKDFLKAGKPVLACFGPVNEPQNRMDPMGSGPDKFEDALSQLGIKMARQTVLFNVESKSFAERRGGLLVLGANIEVPPVEFDWPQGAGEPPSRVAMAQPTEPNPIRESMRLTAESLGKDQKINLRLRHPRPIYFEPPSGFHPKFQPDFMMTTGAGWNEDQPFPTPQRTPRFEPAKPNDFTKGTLDEKRRGPFPIGVAVETPLPASWYTDKNAKPAVVRVAAIGQGAVFKGATLSPAQEKLLLDSCNWLLGRDDLLTKANRRWEYPRVALSDRAHGLWQWGIRLGLPVLFAYLGFVVLLVRRLR